MLFSGDDVRIWLYAQPTEIRKSFDGLSAMVKNQLQEDPLSGQLFVFINRRQTQMKALYFDHSGYCIWSKRLD
jgi:transposase